MKILRKSYLRLHLSPLNDAYLDCPSLRDPALGNALPGGIRLPHVATEVHGHLVGAPLGNYGGVETISPYGLAGILPNVSFIPVSGGTYLRYTDQELAEKYGFVFKHRILDAISLRYLVDVVKGAEYAASKGWINQEEKLAYIKTALECAHESGTGVSAEESAACHGI